MEIVKYLTLPDAIDRAPGLRLNYGFAICALDSIF